MPNSVQIEDLFNGAAGTLLAAHTPNSGGPWSIPGGRAPTLDGVAKTQWLNTGGLFVLDPLGDAVPQALAPGLIAGDVTLIWSYRDLGGAGSSEDDLGMLARYTDVDHYYQWVWIAGDGGLKLQKRTNLGTFDLTEYFPSVDAGAGFPVVCQISGAVLATFLPDGVTYSFTDGDSPYTDPGQVGITGAAHGNSTPTTGDHLSQALAIAGLLFPMP